MSKGIIQGLFYLPRFAVSKTCRQIVVQSAVLIYLMAGDLVSGEDCKKISDCSFSCSGESFDLSPLGDSSGQPKYKDVPATTGQFQYSYNPCYPFTETQAGDDPDCTKVASCQKVVSPPVRYHDCGVQSSVVFQKLPGNEISPSFIESKELFFVASYTSAQDGRTTKVLLDCANSENFTAFGEDPNSMKLYVFLLQTPLLCGSSPTMSIGSILLITFFALVIVYFIVGTLFMRLKRGASGVEMIPNRDTWAALPGFIKGGVMFLLRGCKPGPSGFQKL